MTAWLDPMSAEAWALMRSWSEWLRQEAPEAWFWSQVDASGDCWLWTSAGIGDSKNPYGGVTWNHVRCVAHRVAYELLVGPVPEGLVLDHLCRVKRCVNPDHLEPVTNRENILRGYGITAREARRAECVNGHSLADAYRRNTGYRRCRVCCADQQRAHRARRAERRAAVRP